MSPFTAELSTARAAQAAWVRLHLRERLKPIRGLRALLVERADAICDAIAADIARPPVEVLGTELLPTAAALKFLEKRAERLLAPARVSWWDQPTWLMGTRDVVHRRPWGVVGVIGTWNYPLYLNVVQIAQALTAGNAVLWKPSENVPRTAELTHQLFHEAGFPLELIQLLPASREAGPRLAETNVDHVVFTGSDAVGRKLAAHLGERLIPSTLELSGCDAMFVLADANIELAARAAWFALSLNRGQTCIAVRRIFVQRERLETFTAALSPLVRSEPLPLVMESQKTHAERLVEEALSKGAKLLGNSTSKGDGSTHVLGSGVHMEPTFLLNASPDAAICREACFAPIAAILPFDTIDSALSIARQSSFGLAASIFSADAEKAKELAECIPAGHVSINDILAPTAHPATPFGGRGASGWGVTQGAEGLLAMAVPQTVTVHTGSFRPHFDEAVKPDPATADILRGLLAWTHARGLRAKFGGLSRMIRGIRRKK